MNVEKSEPGGFILAHMLIHSNPLLSAVYRAPSLQGTGPGYSREEPGRAELSRAEPSSQSSLPTAYRLELLACGPQDPSTFPSSPIRLMLVVSKNRIR